jgi:large subunit ribosomal protein L35
MPKMKTRKCAAKRFKRTGTGKWVHYRAGARHIMTKKSSKRKRRLRQSTLVNSTDLKRITASLP